MLAYFVHDLSPFLIEFGHGIGIRWYGLAYVAAFFFGYLLYRNLANRGFAEIPPEKVGDFITWGAVFGVLVGGRLGYMLFYDLDAFVRDPLIVFRLWDGGMASHGGIIGLTLYTLWYSWRHRVSWRNIGDNLVVCAPIGLFLGRIANFINGELYGRPASGIAWAVQFPKEMLDPDSPGGQAVIQEAAVLAGRPVPPEDVLRAVHDSPELKEICARLLPPRHPSQLYEALLEGVTLFAILWILRTRVRLPDGVLTGVFFIAYAALRFAGEVFRQPDAPLTGPFTRGQFLSLFLVLIGAAFIVSAVVRTEWAPRFRAAPGERRYRS